MKNRRTAQNGQSAIIVEMPTRQTRESDLAIGLMFAGAALFVVMPLLTVVTRYTTIEAALGVGFLVNTVAFVNHMRRLRLWVQIVASEILGLSPICILLLRGVPALSAMVYWLTLFAGSLLAIATSLQVDTRNDASIRNNHLGWRHPNGCRWPNFKVVHSMQEQRLPATDPMRPSGRRNG